MKLSGSRKRLFTRKFWDVLETKYYLLFLLAVFFSFSSLGFVSDLLNDLKYSYPSLAAAVLSTGLFSTAFAYSATKKLWLLPVFVVVQIVYMLFIRPDASIELTPEILNTKATVTGFGVMASVILGYSFFITFSTKVGIKHFLMKAEMDLAKEIHEVLVPEINLTKTRNEIFGKSIPTSEVGGDLIDVITKNDNLICAISDVSGHGVSSGVYTGMFKSALHSALQSLSDLSSIMININDSLHPLMKKNMFITSALIKFNKNQTVEYLVAGHLPILHFREETGTVDELIIKQIPIGFKSKFEFNSAEINYSPGDIFVMITDGITETVNKKGDEFGLEKVKEIINENHDKSAAKIAGEIFEQAKSFGNQKDDVTLLVVKC